MKDFNNWNSKKIIINDIQQVPFFHKREIWFCSMGINVGFEQDGLGSDFQRPIIIIKKFNNEVFWAVPLSKTKKRGKYYFEFQFDEEILSVAVLSQIKLMDAHRLSRKIGNLDDVTFQTLIEKLKTLLS